MKLTAQDTTNLLNALAVCSIGGIDDVIIEDGIIRGVNEARNFVIFSNNAVPNFPEKIGIKRAGALKQRLDLFKDAIIETKENDRHEVNQITISSGKTKADFRCTSPSRIPAPKSVNDNNSVFNIFLTKDEVKTVMNALKALSAKTAQIVIKRDKSVCIQIIDETNDTFDIILSNPAEVLDDEVTNSVIHYHHADTLHTILRYKPNEDISTLLLSGVGTIRSKINGHDVIIMPKINDQEEDD